MKAIKLAFQKAIAYQIWSKYEEMVAIFVEEGLLPLRGGANQDFFL